MRSMVKMEHCISFPETKSRKKFIGDLLLHFEILLLGSRSTGSAAFKLYEAAYIVNASR